VATPVYSVDAGDSCCCHWWWWCCCRKLSINKLIVPWSCCRADSRTSHATLPPTHVIADVVHPPPGTIFILRRDVINATSLLGCTLSADDDYELWQLRLTVKHTLHTLRPTPAHTNATLTLPVDFDSTAIRPRYDHSTTYVTTVGLPVCRLLH